MKWSTVRIGWRAGAGYVREVRVDEEEVSSGAFDRDIKGLLSEIVPDSLDWP